MPQPGSDEQRLTYAAETLTLIAERAWEAAMRTTDAREMRKLLRDIARHALTAREVARGG